MQLFSWTTKLLNLVIINSSTSLLDFSGQICYFDSIEKKKTGPTKTKNQS